MHNLPLTSCDVSFLNKNTIRDAGGASETVARIELKWGCYDPRLLDTL